MSIPSSVKLTWYWNKKPQNKSAQRGLFLYIVLLNKATVIGKNIANQINFSLYVIPDQANELRGDWRKLWFFCCASTCSIEKHFAVNSRQGLLLQSCRLKQRTVLFSAPHPAHPRSCSATDNLPYVAHPIAAPPERWTEINTVVFCKGHWKTNRWQQLGQISFKEALFNQKFYTKYGTFHCTWFLFHYTWFLFHCTWFPLPFMLLC